MSRIAASAWACLSTCALWSALAVPSAAIDDKVLTSLYHEGAKAYFASDYRKAHDALTQVIEAGGKDPRAYYFRGLANARLGRTSNAQLDFTKGAEIEGQDFDTFYNVSAALERVQGPDRRALETYRQAGRKNALAAIEKIRFEKFRRFEPSQGTPSAATTVGQPAPDASAPATDPAAMPAAATASDPFAAPAPAAPATAAPADAGGLFGAPAAGSTMPEAPAASPAGGNPFGGGAPAASPFGAPATPAPPASPAGATPPAAPANPFGS